MKLAQKWKQCNTEDQGTQQISLKDTALLSFVFHKGIRFSMNQRRVLSTLKLETYHTTALDKDYK
eukprot:7169962-Ditylum_brightwellii.AAC.1